MPIPQQFKERLFPAAEKIAGHFATPFHIYDEAGIRATCKRLQKAFSGVNNFKEFYAVKALPNPAILKIMKSMGCGFDCSSQSELLLARQAGAAPDDIMFTSNNTSSADFASAFAEGGCILNLDDISLLDKAKESAPLPELLSFRYNPGERRSEGNEIIGLPTEAKYGVSHQQIFTAYKRAKEAGVQRFGLHTMLASNERNYKYMVQTAQMLLELIAEIGGELGIAFEFINIGGGFGIPYEPDAAELDIEAMGREISELFTFFEKKHGYQPALFTESGRYMTGPHGVLVTKAINRKDIYRTYIGVDASMSALMRPGMYGAYHHIEVVGKDLEKLSKEEREIVDVVGALCENNDKFAIQRELPKIVDGDLLVIEDTGAHGIAMGFNYNGSLRPKELLLQEDGTVRLIRRAETIEDYFATLNFRAESFSVS